MTEDANLSPKTLQVVLFTILLEKNPAKFNYIQKRPRNYIYENTFSTFFGKISRVQL